jgi:DNA anti-recombination protein RmuC
MLKESAERIADAVAALSSRCVLLAGQLGAAGKLLAEAQTEIEGLKKQVAEKRADPPINQTKAKPRAR